jgi:hypothetical protein
VVTMLTDIPMLGVAFVTAHLRFVTENVRFLQTYVTENVRFLHAFYQLQEMGYVELCCEILHDSP